ncbi:hypothetical protein LOK74_23995 [Brevibacillus humidisoli]|nr:hypothetical protein [Brevibacillus humidisoli]UFJ40985.1 hypothetical protein LOK74_23995 [Brevibacillus humidisoli]
MNRNFDYLITVICNIIIAISLVYGVVKIDEIVDILRVIAEMVGNKG